MTTALATGTPIRGRARTLALTAILLATFVDLMYVTLLNVVLPAIEHGLGASPAQLQWMLSGYTLALAVGIVTGARLGDRFGHKHVFLVGLLGFTAASALCAAAPGADWLVAARIVQGAFAAAMLPQVLTQIQVIYPPAERGGPMAAFSSLAGLAATLGPLLGPALMNWDLAGQGWRLVFWIIVPVGLVCAAAAAKYLPHSRAEHAPRLDGTGVLLSAAGMFLLLYPLISHSDGSPWTPGTWGLLTAGLALTAVFVLHQQRRARTGKSPILTVALFRIRSFSGGLAVQTLFFIPVMGFFLIFMLFLQNGLRLSPARAGLVMLPWSVMVAVFAAVSAIALLPRLGRGTVQIGLAVLAAGLALIAYTGATATDTAAWWPLMTGVVIGGAGMGMVVAPIAQLTLGDIPVDEAGSGSAMFNTFTQLAASIGIAVIGLVFFTRIGTGASPGSAIGAATADALWAGIAMLAAAFAATYLLPRRAPEAGPPPTP